MELDNMFFCDLQNYAAHSCEYSGKVATYRGSSSMEFHLELPLDGRITILCTFEDKVLYPTTRYHGHEEVFQTSSDGISSSLSSRLRADMNNFFGSIYGNSDSGNTMVDNNAAHSDTDIDSDQNTINVAYYEGFNEEKQGRHWPSPPSQGDPQLYLPCHSQYPPDHTHSRNLLPSFSIGFELLTMQDSFISKPYRTCNHPGNLTQFHTSGFIFMLKPTPPCCKKNPNSTIWDSRTLEIPSYLPPNNFNFTSSSPTLKNTTALLMKMPWFPSELADEILGFYIYSSNLATIIQQCLAGYYAPTYSMPHHSDGVIW
ncbi:hypothetical protein BDY19DRAFT_903637 [Irpex rosettiformis]|uniref:Uncharacterized protein n=1 Tax=Irpex rosettiformis TaxID=378272 RepID=A0ACB8UF33_9APHY|nr:hypothetical protein BDY19DRAFT_903637 [Irpex rosettiformis]